MIIRPLRASCSYLNMSHVIYGIDQLALSRIDCRFVEQRLKHYLLYYLFNFVLVYGEECW